MSVQFRPLTPQNLLCPLEDTCVQRNAVAVAALSGRAIGRRSKPSTSISVANSNSSLTSVGDLYLSTGSTLFTLDNRVYVWYNTDMNKSAIRFCAVIFGSMVALGLMFGAIATNIPPRPSDLQKQSGVSTTTIPDNSCHSTGESAFVYWEDTDDFTHWCNEQDGTIHAGQETGTGLFISCVCR